jgi:hypothetical protein
VSLKVRRKDHFLATTTEAALAAPEFTTVSCAIPTKMSPFASVFVVQSLLKASLPEDFKNVGVPL